MTTDEELGIVAEKADAKLVDAVLAELKINSPPGEWWDTCSCSDCVRYRSFRAMVLGGIKTERNRGKSKSVSTYRSSTVGERGKFLLRLRSMLEDKYHLSMPADEWNTLIRKAEK